MSDRMAVLPQYLFPKQALTSFAGWVSSRERGWVTTQIIRSFVVKYQVNMEEAINPDVSSYLTFNDFFTRELKPGARPIADADLVSPVDGAVSQFGTISKNQIFQAKGHNYTTAAVVGGDAALAAHFEDGSFATLYLSPKDYHRIHMPCDGRLTRMIYVPGDLFSVNPTTARGVPGLFARNERVVCVFESVRGPFVLILVGATIVGSMATVWHGVVNPARGKVVRSWTYGAPAPATAQGLPLAEKTAAPVGGQGQPGSAGYQRNSDPSMAAGEAGAETEIFLKKGEEMGRFLLGSTVVMLFPKGPLAFNPAWAPGQTIRLGEAMGNYAD